MVCSLVLALDGCEALRGDAERIGDGDTDAARADVQAENAGMKRIVGGAGGHSGIICRADAGEGVRATPTLLGGEVFGVGEAQGALG